MLVKKSLEQIALISVLALTTCALAIGIWRAKLWASLSTAGVHDLTYTILAALIAAALVHGLTRFSPALALASCFGLLFVVHIGLAPLLAVALLALAALALGQALTAELKLSAALRVVVGLALQIGSLGWLLPWPVHYRGSYLLLLLAPIVWQRRALLAELRNWLFERGAAEPASPWVAAFSVLVMGVMALPTALPTTMGDDIAYHLGLPSELLQHGYYRLDAATTVWANAPWATDLVHGLASVLSGTIEGRGAVHWLWYGLALCLFWQLLAKQAVPTNARWLALALFASQPMQFQLAFGMHTEMATQTLILALLLLIGEVDGTASARRLLAIAAVAGLCLATKILTLVYLAPLAIWFGWRWRCVALQRLFLPALLILMLAGSSYFYSYAVSGNPVLPLFNDVFKSPFYPAAPFRDTVYRSGVDLSMPWRLVFDSPRLHEGYPGVGGFQWLFVFVLLPWLLWHRRSRVFALLGLAAVTLLWLQIQHLRYSLPALLPLAVALAVYGAERAPRLVLALSIAASVGNVMFAQNVFYLLREGFVVEYLLKPDGSARYLQDRRPERFLLRELAHRGESFLLFQEDNIHSVAELAGRGITASWSDPATYQAFYEALAKKSDQALAEFFAERGISHVMINENLSAPLFLQRLQALGTLQRTLGAIRLYALTARAATAQIETRPHAVTYRLSKPKDQPAYLRIKLDVECQSAQADPLLLRMSFDDQPPVLGRLLSHKVCRAEESLQLQHEVYVKGASERVVLEISSGQGPSDVWRVAASEFSWRRDYMAARDYARNLRGLKI